MPDFIRTYSVNGRTYVYFRPPAAMAERGGKARRLSDDVEAARGEAAALVRAWKAKEKEPSRRYTWRGKMLALLRGAKARARAKGRQFGLTLGDLTAMLDQQGRLCAVTRLPFVIDFSVKDYWRHPYAPSLDRIDAAGGYTAGNVRLVISAVNVAMGEWGERVFLTVAAAALAAYREREQNGKLSKGLSNDATTPNSQPSPALSIGRLTV